MNKKRVEHLRRLMKEKEVDTVLISNFENQYYFSGLKAITYSRPILLKVSQSDMAIVIPTLEENHAKHITAADQLYVYHEVEGKEGEYSYLAQVDALMNTIPAGSKVGIEFGSLPTRLAFMLKEKRFEVENIESDIVNMRAVKSAAEISMIKESGKLVSEAVKLSLENVKAGLSELEMDYFGTEYLFKEVSNSYPNSTLDYFVMSPSGVDRTNMPHVFSNSRKIEEGDIIIHSRQVGLNGYRAECERTIFIGEPTEEQRKAFEVMVEAQQKALDFIKVGVTAKEVNQVALDVFKEAGLEEHVVHRTGHGIGIGLHEEPSLRFDNDLVLEAGMVFCVEPGIYIPGVGGFRHSDTVVLEEDKTVLITEYPRDIGSLIIK
ncbi:Xaa-Pro peptidase family protein [Jeotgalicoccus huakuii]|nr:Xaa-Pro peptidase family protein [Jeotgalicoccus huakuii]